MLTAESLTAEALRLGYLHEDGVYRCIACGKRFHEGEVYPEGQRLLLAGPAARLHYKNAHPGHYSALLAQPSKYNPLTEKQAELFRRIAAGESDRQIADALGVAASTVRHQRFTAREKAKQARAYLALYEYAFSAAADGADALMPVQPGLRGVDERFEVTRAEQQKILNTAFESLEPMKLAHFPVKEKKKVVILQAIAGAFQPGRDYSEREVNEVLGAIWHDYVTLRRYLVEYGYLCRERDGSRYWAGV